ncbi:DUF4129 domain-containing protein [Timonella senegalensis]|uniref:DUF4129 domain-containing protein n=1 Tax=Timonella senegalensis TaxID=1465825 RepID=UPI002FDCF81C
MLNYARWSVHQGLDAPPLTPDADAARTWLESELRNPIYNNRESWFSRIWRRITEWLDSLSGADFNPWFLVLVVVGLIVVGVIGYLVMGPVRRSVRAKKSGDVSLLDPTLTALDYLALARSHAGRGDYAAACVDGFRGVIRSAEENVVISLSPGRTASEAAKEIASARPTLSNETSWAANLFDGIEYGSGTASAEDCARMIALVDKVESSRAPRSVVGESGEPTALSQVGRP